MEQELYVVLDRLVRRMTHRLFGTPRLMQLDVGAAISLLLQSEHPHREYLASQLGKLLRELGNRRPDLHQHILFFEENKARLADRLGIDDREACGGLDPRQR